MTLFAAALLLATAGTALANPVPFTWHEDFESGLNGWYTADLTAGAAPYFHWDPYMAYEGTSWWCGNFDYDADGGYGNSWDDRLDLPPIELDLVAVDEISWGALKSRYREAVAGSGAKRDAVIPMLTFAYRCDSETGYDRTFVEAKVSGAYEPQNSGYEDRVPWTDLGAYGFDLSACDNPLEVRFRFISDGSYSDEDGLYLSVAGAFAVDNIKVYDFVTGDVLFYDTAEHDSPGHCIPSVPPESGDFWHIIDRACPAYSDPHSWWCGDDSDTSLVPPNLRDALISPTVYCYGYGSCIAYAAMHLAIPTVDNDYVSVYGGVNSYGLYAVDSYWGDFEQCDGWSSDGMYTGFDIGQFGTPPFTTARVAFVMHTSSNGCGPAIAGDAGVMIDDVWICCDGGLPEWGGREATNVHDARSYAGAIRSTDVGRRLMLR